MIDYRMADAVIYTGLSGYLTASVLWATRQQHAQTRSGALMTQRRRYTYALFAQGMAAASVLWLLSTGTVGSMTQAVKGWFVLIGPADGIIVAGLLCHALSLVLSPLVWGYLYYYRPQTDEPRAESVT